MPNTPEELFKALGVEFVPIDWDKVKDFNDLKKIIATAIPGVQRGSPQYFAIMPFLKL
jgi:hypothetical protein